MLAERGGGGCGAAQARGCGIPRSRTSATAALKRGASIVAERFHETLPGEFHQFAFRKRIYAGAAQLHADLDAWMACHDEQRPNQGRWRCGKAPMRAFVGSEPIARDKMRPAT